MPHVIDEHLVVCWMEFFIPKGIEDHIQRFCESIEEDLYANNAYALLNM